jgi:hypothetical protein
MTMNNVDSPKPAPRPPRGETSTGTWAVVALVAILIIGGVIYAFSTGDRQNNEALNAPAATTGTGATNKTPTPAPPVGFGAQRH